MANAAITIPFYVCRDGKALTGAAGQMEFAWLMTLDGQDKRATAPAIAEIGGGWYRFEVAYGTVPFDAGDLVGVIDADKAGANGLADAERFIPVEVRLDFYALARLVGPMGQDKTSGRMLLKDDGGATVLALAIADGDAELERTPE